jgi:outer membrane protein insertion porin family
MEACAQVNASTARPARLVGVRVEHAPRTRASFLSSILNPYLAPGAPTGLLAPFATPDPADPPGPVDAATLAGVLAAARGASARLHASGVFADVRPRLVRAGGPFARDGDYELVVGVREKGWMFAKTNTEVGNGEATAVRSSDPTEAAAADGGTGRARRYT